MIARVLCSASEQPVLRGSGLGGREACRGVATIRVAQWLHTPRDRSVPLIARWWQQTTVSRPRHRSVASFGSRSLSAERRFRRARDDEHRRGKSVAKHRRAGGTAPLRRAGYGGGFPKSADG